MADTTDTAAEDVGNQPDPARADDATDSADTGSGEPSDETDHDHDASPNAEAAKWRVKLRAAEAERDALAQRLAAYQRRECESAVADLLDVPADLFNVGGADLAGFYSDDGELDEAALRAAAGALVEMRPRLAKAAAPPPNFGQVSAAPAPPPSGLGWSDLLGRH